MSLAGLWQLTSSRSRQLFVELSYTVYNRANFENGGTQPAKHCSGILFYSFSSIPLKVRSYIQQPKCVLCV